MSPASEFEAILNAINAALNVPWSLLAAVAATAVLCWLQLRRHSCQRLACLLEVSCITVVGGLPNTLNPHAAAGSLPTEVKLLDTQLIPECLKLVQQCRAVLLEFCIKSATASSATSHATSG